MIVELRDFRSFVAVAEELHFGRAAQRLHMSQPPLSQQIRRIEKELGVLLLNRTTRRVWLTGAGSAFLHRAREILDRVERAVEVTRAVGRGEIGNLRIGAIGPAMDGRLPAAIRAFRERFPRISVSVDEAPTLQLLESLRSGRVRIAFVRLTDHDRSGLDVDVISREKRILAVPEGHRLAGLRRPTLRSLRAEPRVALSRHVQPTIHDEIVRVLHDAGAESPVVQEASTVHGVIALVAAGLGVALVPASAALTARQGVRFMPIAGRLPSVEISAAWLQHDHSPLLRMFRGVVGETVPPSA